MTNPESIADRIVADIDVDIYGLLHEQIKTTYDDWFALRIGSFDIMKDSILGELQEKTAN